MVNTQLWQWLRDNKITQQEAAYKMGFTVNYLSAILAGKRPFTRSVKMAFIEVFPETTSILLPEEEAA